MFQLKMFATLLLLLQINHGKLREKREKKFRNVFAIAIWKKF